MSKVLRATAHLSCPLLETNAGPTTIFRNEINPCLFKGSDDTGQIVANGRVRSTFKISNCLTRYMCCFCELGLAPAQHCSCPPALLHRKMTVTQGKLSD
jgi:hypothetical protein